MTSAIASTNPSSPAGSASSANPYAALNGQQAGTAGAASPAKAGGADAAGKSGNVGSGAGAASAQAIQNQFLTLLVTQLQAQDPSNPMDNSQITSQMAQISQVSSMQTLNQTMQAMQQSQLASQSLLAASTIGGHALVVGNQVDWDGKSPSVLGVSLSGAADTLNINVLDSGGNVVDTVNVPDPKAGMNNFTWNGKDSSGNTLPAGSYSFVSQASLQGTGVTTQNYDNQVISAVSWDSNGSPQLVLSNGSRVGMASVAQIS
ncbi:flagellar hook assembly protein FlgD [Paludibacterium yongneupense]|uniref:flagellar hook assembly protein FlgD n=1 Tax=Paludibacterium yongneupense TaxID=400061 RepID=UPI00068800B9|nr:flagellar hook capping FlgD N-terminal domain-containing protein [Paludibacterium yongneupense]